MTFSEYIPQHIKSKVEDKNWSLTFKFEEIPCSHDIHAKEYEKVDCQKCKFDERETWLENTLTNQDANQTVKDKDGNDKTLSKITVVRGKFDDCIGIQKEFN